LQRWYIDLLAHESFKALFHANDNYPIDPYAAPWKLCLRLLLHPKPFLPHNLSLYIAPYLSNQENVKSKKKKRFSTAQSEYSSTFMFPLSSYLIETDTS
jgi:hypothetical protein